MSYTSGRTVKTSRPARPTPVTSATRDARKLINATMGDTPGITVDSVVTADPLTLDAQVRTTITYPVTVDASDLACAVNRLSGVIASTWTDVAVTITRTV